MDTPIRKLGVIALVVSIAGCPSLDTASDEQAVVACATGPTIRGMDVSVYETSIDWAAARAAGIDFAFIRATDGVQYIDPKFPAYWAGAKAAGVIRGAYQFFRPAEDPIAQADLLLAKIGALEPGDLPPVLDVEVSGGLAPAVVEASVRAWVEHVTAAIGRPPIIYAGLYSWHDLTGSADLTSSPLWVAQYTSAPCPDIPAPWTHWRFWQDTATGSIDGVPGSTLDLDLFDGTVDDLRAFTFAGTCGDGVCSGGETPASCAGDCPSCGTIAAEGGEIDDGDRCFVAGGPTAFLRAVVAGEEGDLIWTHATDAATEANYAQWNLDLEVAGAYRVDVFTAQPWARSTRASYVITAAGVTTTIVLDQSAADGWQTLGTIDFAAGPGQSIHLGDNTGEAPADNVQLVFDAVRLVPIDAPPADDLGSSGCSTTHPANLAILVLFVLRRPRKRSASRVATAPSRVSKPPQVPEPQ